MKTSPNFITNARLVDAEVKDARNHVYYAPVGTLHAVFDGDVALESPMTAVGSTDIFLRRAPVGMVRFLVS